jgi:N-acetylglucosaminyl-diphospho-decaprenol L-rhamnosyltransferase
MPPITLDLSVIIINWNTKKLLLDTIASIYTNLPDPYNLEIIVVDNGSSDGSPEALLATFPQVHLIANPDNRGFSPANNQALRIASGRYSLLLNSDTLIQPNSLKQVIEFMDSHPSAGLCGVQVLNADGTFQGSYAGYLNLGREFLILTGLGRRLVNPHYPSYGPAQSQQTKTVPTIQGAFMFARTTALAQIGWLDEGFFMYGEENDLSLRLRHAGWEVYYLAEVKLIHLGGQSTRKNATKMVWQLQQSKVRLFKKHYGLLPALLLKLLVCLAVLAKLLPAYAQQLLPRRREQVTKWCNWSDLWNFIRTT